MAPADDYSTPTSGSKLKLKGVKDSKVDKKKKINKKKHKRRQTEDGSSASAKMEALEGTDNAGADEGDGGEESGKVEVDGGEEGEEGGATIIRGKTEAERRHEEMRRKRVCACAYFPRLGFGFGRLADCCNSWMNDLNGRV